ncbi:hypothetical protein [Streptococcus gordonii]|jgi:hypothetical protein|uniref:hypothetical protein n=1 Tax=Streptococcus gordonii TaxID=1302 RepID=UPI0006B23B5C|nr:hypothetical protein [Streptococcus gordonii]ALD70966.1 hypothetical protein RN86_00280 [Streptococcus gordonii]MBN2958247.1 hypothetical protein [Streptococcus gordonii]MCY7135975.1 hypothetical protein [Streptococcus gordonii]
MVKTTSEKIAGESINTEEIPDFILDITFEVVGENLDYIEPKKIDYTEVKESIKRKVLKELSNARSIKATVKCFSKDHVQIGFYVESHNYADDLLRNLENSLVGQVFVIPHGRKAYSQRIKDVFVL